MYKTAFSIGQLKWIVKQRRLAILQVLDTKTATVLMKL